MTKADLPIPLRMPPIRALGVLLSVAIVSGCGGDDRTEPALDSRALNEPAVTSTPPTGAATTTAAEQTFTVRITDASIEVSPATARPGPATFQVSNNAGSPQDVEIDGPWEDGEVDDLPPNETRSVRMTLEAGEYEIKSENDGGADQERRTRLVVRN